MALSVKGYFLSFYIKNTLLIERSQFLKKIKRDFWGYEMGIGGTHYLKGDKPTANNTFLSHVC
jgi:hypothetical protein